MRVLVNAAAVQGGGGRTYLVNIMAALAAATPHHDYQVVLTSRQRELIPMLPEDVSVVVCRSAPASAWLRIAWEQAALPALARRWKADLVLAGFNTAPLFVSAPVVLVAHSVNAYSELPIPWSRYMVARHAALRWLGRRSAAVARRIIFVSETSARVMAPRMGAAPDRVRVVHYGWRPPAAGHRPPAARPGLPARYLLTVGDLLDHKNVETLLLAFDRLANETGYDGDLVIVGSAQGASPAYAEKLRRLGDDLSHGKRVHFLGPVPHTEIAAIYRGADLFALPSLEETFGLPLVEAMGWGVPVVAADWRLNPGGEGGRTNVGPEICGETAEFFDPEDPRSLTTAMRRILEDDARRAELQREGPRRASRFSWERAARELLAVIDEARAGR